MARTPTERVTVRLSKAHLAVIDNMQATEQVRNRTDAIAQAVRDWINKKSLEIPQVLSAQKGQVELQKVLSQMADMQATIAKLQKK